MKQIKEKMNATDVQVKMTPLKHGELSMIDGKAKVEYQNKNNIGVSYRMLRQIQQLESINHQEIKQ